ncbi:hypothetical protein niasHS_004481 [Heterodera schachtii]|uniref:Uncharacterized protein n=1 Tax=Heterodera schachtii TaxID=97005 RepID=A0ABD2JJB0_HETSC
MVDLFGVTQGLLAREKRAETSKIPLRIGPDLDVLEEMIRAKLNEEIKNMVEEDRTILDATKEMGMEAWVQAYQLSIEKPGATDKWVAIEDTDVKVSTIQGIGQTFVQQLKVTVGNTEVYDSGNLYPFKAYITNELSFPVNAKKNFLGSTGYYHTERHNDETDDGFKERCKVFKGGNSAQFLSRLDFDLGNQELYLLNNLDLLFTIYKAKDAFLLQTLKANDDTKYRLTVHDVKIYAKMIEVQPSLNMNLYKTLEKQPATYAVRKTEIKSSYISSGRYEFEYNVFSSTIPRRVTIALVSNSAFNGDYKLTPFKFDPFDLREISVHAGGMPVQQPHQQPDADAELQAQIEDAEEDLLLNWWREDPTIIRFLFGNRRAPAIEAALLQRAEHEAEIFRQYAENQQQQ